MACLEIRHADGESERVEFSSEAPLLVGSSAAADIVLNGEDISPIHCRFALRRDLCEVTAATGQGVAVNGDSVDRQQIGEDDVVQIGEVEIRFVLDSQSPSKPKSSIPPLSMYELEVDDAAHPVISTWQPAPKKPSSSPPSPPPAVSAALPPMYSDSEFAFPESEPELPVEHIPVSIPAPAWNRPVRPGEQDPLRSPLVMSLAAGTLLLLFSAVGLWFYLARDRERKAFAQAETALNNGLYSEAIVGFEKYLTDYPSSERATAARVAVARARVDQVLSGASPQWAASLKSLNEFLEAYRDDDEFKEANSLLRRFAVDAAAKIAVGSLRSAASSGQRPLLATSREAEQLVTRYRAESDSANDAVKELDLLRRNATAAILKFEAIDEAGKKIDTALTAKKTLAAWNDYEALRGRYPDISRGRLMRQRIDKSLEIETGLVTREELALAAEADGRPLPGEIAAIVTLSSRKRERSDTVSEGKTIWAAANGSIFGLDAMTGELRFRTPLGTAPVFFPVPVSVRGVPAWILPGGSPGEIQAVEQATGKVFWRASLNEQVTGSPLVVEGQLFVAASKRLVQIDLETGRALAGLTFSQVVRGPPAVSASGERLYLPGDARVLYVLGRRPLGCQKVLYTGHGAGAIVAPLLTVRNFLFLAENDRDDSSRLRVFGTTNEVEPQELAPVRLAGQVRQPLALRGKHLFVASQPEQVSFISISENQGEKPLTLMAQHQPPSKTPGSAWVTIGPDDQVWLASSQAWRIRIANNNALLGDPNSIAIGPARQPLQLGGQALFVGQSPPYTTGVTLVAAQREQMAPLWRTTVGAPVLAATDAAADGTSLVLTEAGDIFRLAPARVETSGSEMQPVTTLNLPATTTQLHATRLHDGRVAAWTEGATPGLFFVGGDVPVRAVPLKEPLRTPPALLEAGLVAGLSDRLSVLASSQPNAMPIEDYRLPLGGQETWAGLTRLDDQELIASLKSGRVLRIQVQREPLPHLAEITRWDAGGPLEFGPVVCGERLILADNKQQLILLDSHSLEPLDTLAIDAPVRQSPIAIGPRALAVAGETLRCYSGPADGGRKLKLDWSFAIGQAALVGPPVEKDAAIHLALSDGRVVRLNPQTGEALQSIQVEFPLAFGPFWLGEQTLVGTRDGALYRLAP